MEVKQFHSPQTSPTKMTGMCLGIFLVVTAIYFTSLFNGWTNWDDNVYIIENPHVYYLSWLNLKQIFTSTVSGIYTPLTVFSFALEYHFANSHPFLYHLDNLILHLVVTFFVFTLALRMRLSFLTAFLAAIIFGVHPMHVESVAWITERKDVLYAFFYLLAVHCYWSYLEKNSRRDYLLSIVFGILSMLAKPMALSLVFIFILCDVWQKRSKDLTMLWDKLPHLFYIVLLSLITYLSHARVPGNEGWLKASAIWIYSFSFYIQKFFWPFGLTPQYQLPLPVTLVNPVYLMAIAVFLLVLFFVFIYPREKLWRWAIFYYFLSIFFLLRFDQGYDLNIVADRFMYLPSVGFCLWTAEVMAKFIQSHNKLWPQTVTKILCSILIAGLSLQAFSMTRIWKDSVTLWSHVINCNPHLATAYNNRGEAYGQKGLLNLALADYDKALDLDPYHASSYQNKAHVFDQLGDEARALQNLNLSIKLNISFQSLYNRGNIYLKQGKWDLALADYNQALQIKNDVPQIHNNRGIVLLNQHDFSSAIDSFSKAVILQPNFFDAYNNRGYVFLQENRLDEALNDFNKALEINSQDALSYYNRANVYRLQNRLDLALKDYDKAVSINPQLGFAYVYRSITLKSLGDPSGALKDALYAESLGIKGLKEYIGALKGQ